MLLNIIFVHIIIVLLHCISYFSNILHIEQNVDALYVRAMCLYFQDNIDKAFAHFQQVLRLAPDHAKALELYKVGNT